MRMRLGGAFGSALLVLATTGCSGDTSDPVEVLQQVSAPGSSGEWSSDAAVLEEVDSGEWEPVEGQVLRRDGQTDEEGSEVGERYAVVWSRSVDSDDDAVCGEAVAWFTENAGRLPGDLEEDDGPVPSPQDQLAGCLDAVAATTAPDESSSDGFRGYPDSVQGDFEYGMFAEVRTRGVSNRLTVIFAATRRG